MNRNFTFSLLAAACLFVVISCGWMKSGEPNSTSSDPKAIASPTPTQSPIGDIRGTTASAKRAFRIEGDIDEAHQEGDVCDTSKTFKVPGTLEFEFTPTDAMKGTYTYSGPFNATGSGPYEIRDDGTMLVDGTGCIMGKCATYSHEWKATAIDPTTCKEK
jgi:hypothetical protein